MTKAQLDQFEKQYLQPFLQEYCGLVKTGKHTFCNNGREISVVLQTAAAHFNPGDVYRFTVAIHLLGRKDATGLKGTMIDMLKKGHHLIATMDVGEIVHRAPQIFELAADNAAVVMGQLKNILIQPEAKRWWAVQATEDIENLPAGGYSQKIYYGTAVYLALQNNTDASRKYFLKLADTSEAVRQAAKSLGVPL